MGKKMAWNDHEVSPDDPVLNLFSPLSDNATDDLAGHAIWAPICPAVFGNGNDRAVWTKERIAEQQKRICDVMSEA